MTTKATPVPESAEYSYCIVEGKQHTPSDTADIFSDGGTTRAIRVQGAGDIALKYQDGTTHTFPVSDGEWIAVAVKRILATGTTVTRVDVFR